jgi:DNA-binding transcriptional LysR family regulator
LHEGNSGHLNIAVGVALQSSQGFVDLISNINSNFPNISLNISSMIKDTCLPLLKDGEVDLWIGDIGDLTNDDQLIKKFIKKIPLVLYANKNNQLFNQNKISLSNLKNQKWSLILGGILIKKNKSDTFNSIVYKFQKNGIDITKNLTTFSSPTALFASVKNNGNFAIAAKSLNNIAKNFDLKEVDNINILDLDVGIIVRNKISNYKIIKKIINFALKNLG